MDKHLILVHGRSFKPQRDRLRALWFEAIEHGLERDNHRGALDRYGDTTKTFTYYGDISNNFLVSRAGSADRYNEVKDFQDRRSCLDRLKSYRAADFLDESGRRHYRALDGASAWKRRCANVLEPLDTIGLAEPLVHRYAADVSQYWNPDTEFGSSVRWRLTVPLRDALESGHDICLVAHSLGAVVSYDVMWKLSYYGEYKALRDRNVAVFITLGSPLGNKTVKRHLKGSRARGRRRYPTLIRGWTNLAAEDDYISHDMTLRDDYFGLVTAGVDIQDIRLYNLAVRHQRAHPHHGAGYLIHPLFIKTLANWLTT